MSIESNLENLVASSMRIERLLEQLIADTNEAVQAPLPVPVPAAVQASPVLKAIQAAAPAAPVPAPAPMPEPAPAAVPTSAAPFTDAKGVMTYCMGKYASLGPVKGGMIQQVLLDMGHANLTNLQPAQYAEFFAKVEAL